MSQRVIKSMGLVALIVAGAALGYWVGRQDHAMPSQPSTESERQVLYWYDPMYPQQRFDQPGKSPFMDMQLVPRYADSGANSEPSTAMQVDPRLTQNLGMRLVTVLRGQLANELDAVGTLGYDQRAVVLLQARSAAFVERVY